MEKKKLKKPYTLTLKGLIWQSLCTDGYLNIAQVERTTNLILDDLELYLRRHYSKDGHPALVFDIGENAFKLVTLSKK